MISRGPRVHSEQACSCPGFSKPPSSNPFITPSTSGTQARRGKPQTCDPIPKAAVLLFGNVTFPWCSLHQSDMLSSNSSGCLIIRLGPCGWEKPSVTKTQHSGVHLWPLSWRSRVQWDTDLFEFEAGLVYIAGSKPARAPKGYPVSKELTEITLLPDCVLGEGHLCACLWAQRTTSLCDVLPQEPTTWKHRLAR